MSIAVVYSLVYDGLLFETSSEIVSVPNGAMTLRKHDAVERLWPLKYTICKQYSERYPLIIDDVQRS